MRQIVLFFSVVVVLNSCYVLRAHKYRDFNLNDLEKFDAALLPAATTPFQFVNDTIHHAILAKKLDEQLSDSYTYAFLVIRNDSVLYERYFGAVTESTKLPSFSVAKSVTSTLLGIALAEGFIKSLDEPVTNYLPELRKQDQGFDAVTIQHVLDMRSGVKSSEVYTNPFSDVLKMGFANNVSKPALKAKLEKAPGVFDYKSVNTQILALIIEKATGKKLQDYATEKLWMPLQIQFPATWNVDKHQTARAFCCINAAALDYAKLGRLYLNRGNWQGQQVVPESWVQRTTGIASMKACEGYKNQWWANPHFKSFTDSLQAVQFLSEKAGAIAVKGFILKPSGKPYYVASYYEGDFHAQGILGQFVYVHPLKNLIIVRLGHYWKHPQWSAARFIYALAEEL